MLRCSPPGRLARIRSLAFLLLALASPAAVFPLDPSRAIVDLGLDVWRTRDGLPQSSVLAIAQTADGYLWLGTESGLARFDGVRFTVFDRRNTPVMESDEVRSLAASRDGGLWVGTMAGLLRYEGGRLRPFRAWDGRRFGLVQSLWEEPGGALWVGTQGDGLIRVERGRTTVYPAEAVGSYTIWSLLGDPDGSLWIGTSDGPRRLERGRLRSLSGAPGLFEGPVASIVRRRDGSVWLGGRGLSRFADGRFSLYTTADGLLDTQVFCLLEDRHGSLWIGSRRGLNRLAGGRMEAFTQEEGLSGDLVRSLHEDREGSLWVGLNLAGLDRLREGRFRSIGRREGLPDDVAYTVAEDGEGAMWIGTEGGLARLRGGELVTWTSAQGLASDTVTAVLPTRSGAVWVGTRHGIHLLAGGAVRRTYTAEQGLAGRLVLALHEDAGGALWVGTLDGLSRLAGGRITTFTAEDGLPCDQVVAIAGSRDGGLWLGTGGGGLVRFRDGVFTTYAEREGLTNGDVYTVLEDAGGTVWAGTAGGGLARLRDGKITTYTAEDGLFDTVFQVLEDGRDNLWISSNRGISRITRRDLDAFAQGRLAQLRPTFYGVADGMRSAECNGGAQPAGWRSRDGRLWFPTTAGVAVVHPEDLRPNPLPPPVVVESLVVDNEPVEIPPGGARLSLRPGTRRLEIQYTGLSFLAPERTRFRYRLEGFDEDWQDAGTRRAAYYTRLPPGDYRFRVIAANGDGVWNRQGAALGFHLRPHAWETPWFYGLLAPLLASAAWGLHRLRVRRVEGRFAAVLAERNRIAREIHDTLAQGLAGISLQLESVADTLPDAPETAGGHLNRARRLVRESLAEARRAVWDLRPEALEGSNLATALAGLAEEAGAGGTAEVEVELGGDVATGAPRLSSRLEHQLLRIAQEALANAVRHAGARRIRVRLEIEGGAARLSVADDGRGFDPDRAAGNGRLGLRGMAERAAEVGGRMEVRSAPGEGTAVVVEVPLAGNRRNGREVES